MCKSDCHFQGWVSFTTFNAANGAAAGTGGFGQIFLDKISFQTDIL